MSLQLYSKTFVDINYGEGLLGFRLGKTDDDYPVVKGFDKKEDGSSQPLEVQSLPYMNCRLQRVLRKDILCMPLMANA